VEVEGVSTEKSKIEKNQKNQCFKKLQKDACENCLFFLHFPQHELCTLKKEWRMNGTRTATSSSKRAAAGGRRTAVTAPLQKSVVQQHTKSADVSCNF
jgi:hypothetical protein